MTVVEIERFLEACHRKFRPFVLAGLHTGMRPGELFELRWKDVNFESGRIYVRMLGPVKKGTKANGSKIPQGEEWTHR